MSDAMKEAETAGEGAESPAPVSLWSRVVGDYDYSRLCRPRLNPWKEANQKALPFYGPDANLSLLFAIMLGFQHSLAVVGGTIIPGILLGNQDPSGKAGPYLVSYALITSGICTWIQIHKTKVCGTPYFVGSGMLCVIATSFAFLPTAQQSITTQMNEGKTFEEAYGSLLGVFMVGAVLQSLLSFVPNQYLRRIFPQWLAGLAVFLIGANLTRVGVTSWGGGGNCVGGGLCDQVGNSNLPYGSTEYLGLGFFVMTTIVTFELFGSPFLRSCGIAIALLLGYGLASITKDRNGDSYTDLAAVDEAPTVLFLWTKTFPIGFYTPAFLPTMVAYMVSAIETYGDTSATAEASGIVPGNKRYEQTIQGGLLGDAVNSLFSAASMVLPSTTLSQNIGIISLTNVASRSAGYACGCWMILYGVFGKVGAFFTSIPQPVLGGMSTFLFANIAVSGIKVMTSEGIDRRARFIIAIAGSFGLGTILRPNWLGSDNFLDCKAIEGPAVRGVCDAATITLGTAYAIASLIALILNAVLPYEAAAEPEEEETTSLVAAEAPKDDEVNVKDIEQDASEPVATVPLAAKEEIA